MRYILNDEGYIETVSFTYEVECNNKTCTEYTGSVPTGYETLAEWSENANINAYKIVDGELTYDSDKDTELQALWESQKIATKTITINDIYPVGSIYMNINSTNPSELFGGTWEQIKDTFLLACGDTYSNGATGGEATHTLTIQEMPSHQHNVLEANGGGYAAPFTEEGFLYQASNIGYWSTTRTDFAGGNQPHNNMPPYLAIYVWKRIS